MKYSVIPHPSHIDIKDGSGVFKVSSFMKIAGEENTLAARDELLLFLNNVLEIFPVGGEQEIHFILSDCEGKKGSYHILTEKNRINLTANSKEGLFYGVQTLKQLLFQAKGNLCALEIYDEPLYDIRGFMLDCARHFFTKQEVFRFLDLMALHKLNEFHWHLSDDQGFRCQLECAPLLTEIGSVRSCTGFRNVGHWGYYTKKDIKEIIAYAHSKHIKVIPEIESPGHTVSMISAYPELSCREKEISVATTWGIKDDVLCVGKESTFEFMFSLFDELIEMFPDGIIHIGTYGTPVKRWMECPHCQRRMEEVKLTDVKELEMFYFTRIVRFLRRRNIEVRLRHGEKGNHSVNPPFISQKNPPQHKGPIVTAHPCCQIYLPHEQISLKEAYSNIPINPYEPFYNNMQGMEACLWCESSYDINKADFALLPRLGAFSEQVWVNRENKDYGRFLANLSRYYAFLYANGYSPAPRKRALPGKIRKALYTFRRMPR